MTWVDPAQWYQSLPTFHVSASALVTDAEGRVLLVKATYRDHWSFPGGIVEAGEPPHLAAARELAEEAGLEAEVGLLLLVDWAPPQGHRSRAMAHFLFDGGTAAAAADPTDPTEIAEVGFFAPETASELLAENSARRLAPALAARRAGRTVYLPHP
ncbi:ADP-ribose pyrophosphatase [Catellatospora sp. TT07R-123]|uniref:NUDIX domain-containing protein n=1 Tax=Catellatospora sp. TT07R-123 TaxID=2733863 RepID=UPI001B2B6BE6|nr:NUDIX domain-containing protein [Catellatospora sp. TT07R-123]GHJ44456.1 ADP-ribose pyrophosphatase [Catellatospora sp. TT07R-123]